MKARNADLFDKRINVTNGAVLSRGRGIWKDRKDLPDFKAFDPNGTGPDHGRLIHFVLNLIKSIKDKKNENGKIATTV